MNILIEIKVIFILIPINREDLPENEWLKINAPGNFEFNIPLNDVEHETINSFMVYKNESKYEYLWVNLSP